MADVLSIDGTLPQETEEALLALGSNEAAYLHVLIERDLATWPPRGPRPVTREAAAGLSLFLRDFTRGEWQNAPVEERGQARPAA